MNSDQRFAEALARLREDAARLGQLLADYEELERRMGDRDSRGFQSQAVADAKARAVPNFQEEGSSA